MDNLEYDPNRSSRTADTQLSSSQPGSPPVSNQTFAGSVYDSSLEDGSGTIVGGSGGGGGIGSGFGKKSLSPLTYNRRAMAITAAALGMILLIGVSAFFLNFYYARKAANKITSESFKVGKLDTSQIKETTTKTISEAEHLDINGQLQVGNTIILTPTQAPNPSNAVAGQIYYDKTTNQPYYYNGTTFVSITQQAGVTSLGGFAGAIGVGDGLSISGNRISANSAVLQAAAQAGQPHVNTVQGQSGVVSLTGGAGISINGTSFTNTGVLSVNGGNGVVTIAGTTNQLNVATSGSTVTLSLPQDIATSSSPSFDELSVVSGLNLLDSVTSNATTLVGPAVGTLSVNQTISIPQTNYFANTDEVCLFHLANCSVGGGGGVAAAGGSALNYITKFTNAGATQIGNSLLYDNGVSVGINTATPNASYLLDVNGDVNIHGSTGLTLGIASNTTGQLRFANSASSNIGLLTTAALGQATSYVLPDPGVGSDEICLVSLGNCTGSGGGSNFINNQYLTAQTSANLYIQSRGGQVAAKIQGAFNQNIIELFTSAGGTAVAKLDKDGNFTAVGATFNGNAAVRGGTLTVGVPSSVDGGIAFARVGSGNLLTLNAAAVTGTSTVTIPDPGASSDIVCLQTLANCTSGSGGASNFINNQYLTAQTNANFFVQSRGGQVAGKIQGALNQDILNIYKNSDATNPVAKFDLNGALNLGIASSAAGSIILRTTSTGAVTISSAAQGNNVALSVPADINATDTFCLVTLANCGSVSGNGNYINNTQTKQTNANITIASGSGVTAKLQGSGSNDILQLFSTSDFTTPVATFSNAGNLSAGAASLSDNLTLAANKNIFANNLVQTASGQAVTINAGVDGISFLANGRTFVFPATGAATQTICTSNITCVAGGGVAVTIEPGATPQLSPGTDAAIFLNKTGASGNIIQLQSHGTDAFVLDNSGNASFSGNITMATGKSITVDTLQQTGNGNPVTINAGLDGITFSANGRNFTFPTTGAANQTICTSGITCVATGVAVTIDPGGTAQDMPGTGSGVFLNKSGATGNIIQLQSHGTDVFVLDNSGNASLGANATVSGSGGITVGVASSVAGKLVLRTGLAGSVTIDSVNRASDLTVSFPANANPTDTFCLVSLANCGASSGNGNYIQNGTANQNNANFNITAQAGVASKIQGASSQDIMDLYISSNSTNPVFSVDSNGVLRLGIASSATPGKLVLRTGLAGSVTIDSVNRASDLTVSFPANANPTDTFCLVSLANCGASSGNGNYIQNGTANQNNANFNITAQTGVAAKVQGASGQDIADFFTSADGTNPIAKIEGTGILTLGNNASSGALKLVKNGSANTASLMVAPSGLAQNTTFYLPDGGSATDTLCTVNAGNCTASAGAFIANGTTSQSANFFVAAPSGVAAKIQGSGSNDILDIYASSGGNPIAKFDPTSLTLGGTSLTGALKLGFAGSSNYGTIQLNTSGLAQATTFYLPDPATATDTICTVNKGNCTGSNGGSGNSNYIWNTTTAQPSSNFFVQAATSVAARMQGAAGQDIAQFINSGSSTVAKIDANGLLTAAGATLTGTTNINVSINSPTNINTGTSTGAVTIGNSAAGAIGLTSGAAVNISAGAASTISTSTGNLTLQGGSGTVSLGSTTTLTNTGALTILPGGTNTNFSLNTNGTGNLNIGSNASGNNTIQIGNTSGTNTQAINIGNNATGNNNVTLGSSSGASFTSIQAGTGGVNVSARMTATGSGNGSSTYGALFKNSSDSSTAFALQNASSSTLYLMDTLGGNLVANGNFETNTAGWTYGGGAGIGYLAQTGVGQGYLGSYGVTFQADSATSTYTYALPAATVNGQQYTVSFYARWIGNGNFSNNVNIGGGACNPGAITSSITSYTLFSCTATATGGSNLVITDSTNSFATVRLDAIKVEPGSIATAWASGQATYVDSNFRVQNSSGSNILSVQAATSRVYINQSSATFANSKLDVNGNINVTSGNNYYINGLSINAGGTLSNVVYKDQNNTLTGANIFNGNGNNSSTYGTLFKNTSDSTTAFAVQNSSGVNAIKVDTSGGNLIGNGNFEINASGWAYGGGAGIGYIGQSSIGQGYIGSYGALLQADSVTSTYTYTLPAPTTNGQQYTISYYGIYQGLGNFSNNVNIGGGTCNPGAITSATTTWTLFTCTATATGGSTVTITDSTNAFATVRIDAVSLVAGSTAVAFPQNSITSFNGSVYSRSTVNSSAAFQIQNAGGSAALSVDTSTINGIITNQSFEAGTTGWTGVATSAFAQSSTSAYSGSNSLLLTTNATANAGAKYTTGNGSTALATAVTTYTLSWYARNVGAAFTDMIAAYARNGSAETNCTGINTQTVVTTGWTRYTCQITTDGTAPAASAYIIIKQVGATSHQFAIDGVQIETGSIASSYRETAIQLNGRITNGMNLQNAQDSTTAFSVQNAAGSTIFNIDTVNSRIGTLDQQLASTNSVALTVKTGDVSGATSTSGAISLATGNGTSGTGNLSISTGNSTTASGTSGSITISTGTTNAGTGGNISILPNGAGNTGLLVKTANNSTTAFQIQNASSQNLLQVDSSTNTITLGGNLSAELTWTSNSNLITARQGAGTVTANGNIYVVGGLNASNAWQNNVQYAKVNADGSVGAWTTSGNTFTTARYGLSSVVANGYIYAMGGYDNTNTPVTTVNWAKLNPDGSVGTWTTATGGQLLPQVRAQGSAVYLNGYIYYMGGYNTTTTNNSTVYYAKVNADGSIGSWATTTQPLPATLGRTSAVVANGRIYIMGGYNTTSGTAQTATYYVAPGSNGNITSAWTTGASFSSLAASGYSIMTATTANGYIYNLGGFKQGDFACTNWVLYSKISTDGSMAAWTQASANLPGARCYAGSVTVNSNVYLIGGDNSGAQQNVYYGATQRIRVGGGLDLVGIAGGTLGDGQSGLGGDLTAGNTNLLGTLNVQGQGIFRDNLSVWGTMNVGGFANSTSAFQVQNSSGAGIFNVDTTNGNVSVALTNPGSTTALCTTLGNGAPPVANTLYTLVDCNAAPAADYAERYPVASGVGYGDIVATGTQMVNTYDETDGNIDWTKIKGQITQLVKSGAPYQSNTIGVVSNNYGDFTSAGANIKDSDNPMPVALNGRVPVNIASSSDPIQAGDYLTTSGEAGKAMKANGAGYVIGKALASWNPGSGEAQVMVYIEPGYYNGPNITTYLQNGGSGSLVNLNVSGKATITDLEVSGSAKFAGSIIVGGHIITAGNAPVVSVAGGAGAGATIDIDGNDTSGTITITAGSGASAGDLGSITFSQPFGKTPKTILSAQDEDSQTAQIYPTGKNVSSFKLHTSQALQAGKTYTFDYFIVQ